MKKFKKIMAVLVAAMMIMATMVPAWAADTINITNTAGGSVYNVYKIFDLTYDTGETTYAYTIDESNPFFTTVQNFATSANGLTLTEIGDSGKYNVTIDTTKFTGAAAESGPSAANGKAGELAVQLKTVADGFTQAQIEANRAGTATAANDNDSLSISVADHGYYFMTTTTGTIFTLDSTTPTVDVKDKNEKPTIAKTVQEGAVYGKTNDGEIGSRVNYRTIINGKVGAKGYVYHDKMSSGLTYNNDVAIYLRNDSAEGEGVITIGAAKYAPVTAGGTTWSTSAGSEDVGPCNFEVTFVDSWLSANLTTNKEILVTYSALINSTAVAEVAETNTAWLKYGNNNRTVDDVTKTYTWQINIYKYKDTSESTPLAGATFKIVNADKSKVAVITDGKLSSWTNIAAEDDADDMKVTPGTPLTTTNTGKITVQGFDAGTYYLVETDAPAGYKQLEAPVTVTITSSESEGNRTSAVTNAATISGDLSDTKAYLKVSNISGPELPSTGGMGTTVLYIVGGMLVILAGAYLFFSRKRTA